MTLAEIAALAAATCWALGGLFSIAPVKHLGAIPFLRLRMMTVVMTLCVYLLIRGDLSAQLFSINSHDVLLLALSGVIGIWFGDMMIFLTLDRLGPRRTSILFASNAPMQVILGMLFLGETMTMLQIAGCVLVMVGAYCAIVYGKRASQVHQWEAVTGLLIVGVLFGLGSGLGQAVGALIAKPVMDKGTSPEAAVIIRGSASLVVLWACLALRLPKQRAKKPLTPAIFLRTFISCTLGMTIGMSLLLYAMGNGDLGKVAILSAMTPVILLPMLWIKTKEFPALGAWIGAMLAVLGVALLR